MVVHPVLEDVVLLCPFSVQDGLDLFTSRRWIFPFHCPFPFFFPLRLSSVSHILAIVSFFIIH